MKKYFYRYKGVIFMDILCSTLYTISIGAIPIVSQQLLDAVGHLTAVFFRPADSLVCPVGGARYVFSIFLSVFWLAMDLEDRAGSARGFDG